MTFKIGDLQSSTFSLTENNQKSENEKLLSNSVAENEAAINYLANSNPTVKINNPINDGDDKKTVADFLRKVVAEQPLDEKTAGKKIRVFIDAKKPTNQTSVADYDKATWREIFRQAGYGMLTDQEIALAVGAMNSVGWKTVDSGFSLTNLRAEDAKPGPMVMTTTQSLVEKAKRAGQAVLQYQEYQANRRDAEIEYGKTYVNDAMGGFVQVPINGGINLVNGLSEPFRAGEKIVFGTNYIPEVPKLTIAERSEYWNKDGRMLANKGGEIIATGVFGGILGGKAITTQGGRILLGTESSYNIGAGLFGKDITQTDAQGNPRQMEWLERGTRIAGGIFGARQTIKTEISTPKSFTNRATDKLDDIFKNTPTFKPQNEFITPDGFRVGQNSFEKPFQTVDDLNSKIVTVDSNGNPSGTRFRSDYEDHIKNRDFSNPSQKNGVSGAHNIDEFEIFDVSVNPLLTKESIKITGRIPHPTVKGIYNIEYEMPKLNGQLQVTGWRLDKGKPFVKTVYDPSVISDRQMAQWGREAFADAMQKNPVKSGATNIRWRGTASNGLEFQGYADTKGTDSVRTFFPIF